MKYKCKKCGCVADKSVLSLFYTTTKLPRPFLDMARGTVSLAKHTVWAMKGYPCPRCNSKNWEIVPK